MADPFAGRLTELNETPERSGDYVLYWMQQAQRARSNHALEYAIRVGNERRLPVVVVFGLMPDYPDATARHYRFMLEGLADVAAGLKERGIRFVVRFGDPPAVALDLGRRAAAIVCDRGYLRHQREWRYHVGRTAACRVVEVESELIVPVEVASQKQEYAARTIRPRIHRRLGEFLLRLPESRVAVRADASADSPGVSADRPGADRQARGAAPDLRGEDVSSPANLLRRLQVPADPGPVTAFFRGGETEARRRLARFLEDLLPDYEEQRNEPGSDVSSAMSPYLHFGQISSLEIALEAGAGEFVGGLAEGKGRMKLQPGSVGMRVADERSASSRDAFLEELLVRRGLAHNYAWYARDYDRYEGLPDWARRTLAAHATDERPAVYPRAALEGGRTHDPYWNDAMTEMVVTGFMHNYMRMYWAKKILEWSPTPQEAFRTTLELNNRYFLDGRDPNSYANVAWTFGLHDRPWTERPIFGTVRYMNANGLKRKFDLEAYARKVRRLTERAGG